MATTIAIITDVTKDQFWEHFGSFFIDFVCEHGWENLLRSMSPDMADFFNGLDSFHNFLNFAVYKGNLKGPSFQCIKCNDHSVLLHYYTNRYGIHPMVKGATRKIASKFFGMKVDVTLIDLEKIKVQYEDGIFVMEHAVYKIERNRKASDAACGLLCRTSEQLNSNAYGVLQVTKIDFAALQPYHFIADRNCRLIQYGKGLHRHVSMELLTPGTPLDHIFDIIRPHIPFNFDLIQNFTRAVFILKFRTHEKSNVNRHGSICSEINLEENIKLKGQMIIVGDNNRLLFIGSPYINTIPELLGYGMRLEAMPLHDVTRDLILINQQRLSDVKMNIELEAKNAEMEKLAQTLENEKLKTEALLHEMLPTFVATQLINGKKVDACEYAEATVMFSDVPNFQSIVVRCKPRQIVKLLNNLFTKLDRLVERHNVYKVETVADSYMTVGGVPEQTIDHCEILCHLALGMLYEAQSVTDPITKKPLLLRLGINSGPIVAGIVGKKMPRYCLFGDTVNTASRMKSYGIAGKIHCSKAAYECARKTGKFIFESHGSMQIKGKGQMETYFLKSSKKKSIWEIVGTARDINKHSIDGYLELEESLQQDSNIEKRNSQICTAL